MRKVQALSIAAVALALMLALVGCGSGAQTSSSASASSSAKASSTSVSASVSASASASTAAAASTLAPGVYEAEFKTDSSMFHVNEANNGKGELTVAQDGSMTIHVSLASKKIKNLYPGTAAEAQKEGAKLLQPTTDKVTYKDGTTEEVYGFDIPVPALDTDFDCALVGEKGSWYDHKVSVVSPK